jgi:hypothetical protein
MPVLVGVEYSEVALNVFSVKGKMSRHGVYKTSNIQEFGISFWNFIESNTLKYSIIVIIMNKCANQEVTVMLNNAEL